MDIDTHIHIDTSNIYSRKKQVMNWKKYMGVWERVWRAKREGVWCNYNYAHDTHD